MGFSENGPNEPLQEHIGSRAAGEVFLKAMKLHLALQGDNRLSPLFICKNGLFRKGLVATAQREPRSVGKYVLVEMAV